MKAIELATPQAQRLFESFPASLRIVTLSPLFAQADESRENGLARRHVAVKDGDRFWLSSIHVRALGPATGAFGAISPYGYGGPLANEDDPAFMAEAWAAYAEWCRAHAIVAEFARFHPSAANQRFFGGAVSENRQTVTVDLRVDELTAGYSTLARRKLRRAEAAGAAARFSQEPDDWMRFGPFYREAMAAMGADARYHFPDTYFTALRAVPGAWLCICESGGRWLSAGVYLFGAAVVEYHLGAHSPAGYDAGTPHLMQHAAATRGREQAKESLYLGGGISPEPDNPLLFHKLGFSRRMLPFFIGQALHDEAAYWRIAAKAGFDRANPPARLLLD